MILILALCLGYLCGSVPFGVLAARLFDLGDLRKVGSGNIGATNVLRTGSRKAAVFTLFGDALKGTAAVLLARALMGENAAAAAALGAFVGHCFPVWLRFRGGKGVATYLGALLGLNGWLFLVFCGVWLAIAAWKRLSSLAALTASAAVMLVSVFVPGTALLPAAIAVMTALLYWRHRENIARLRSGTETLISFGNGKSSGK